LLREALAADLFFGPAHNNLGVVFLKQGKRYEAAAEFEWARKLMPGHPDPRVNLAMTLEEAGKLDDAIASYSAALEVYPGYLPAVQGAARVALRAGRSDERIPEWLQAIAEQSDDPMWRDWARQELARER
jgi:tetratricopeptide (TPR) repeat protein